jgi:hypothetical protein
MDIFPPLSSILLSAAAPGSLVLYEGSVSIVTREDGGEQTTLAVFQRDAKKFSHAHVFSTDQRVVKIGGDVVIEADIRSGVRWRRPTNEDLSSIFIHDSDAFGIIDIGGGEKTPAVHIFNMGTGKAKLVKDDRYENTPMAACGAWRLGIKVEGSGGEPRWLIEVGASGARL